MVCHGCRDGDGVGRITHGNVDRVAQRNLRPLAGKGRHGMTALHGARNEAFARSAGGSKDYDSHAPTMPGIEARVLVLTYQVSRLAKGAPNEARRPMVSRRWA